MIDVRIEKKPAFRAVGKKTWIAGTDNELFGRFWRESHENGLVTRLKELSATSGAKQTNSSILGVSCVEKDPDCRSFYFYIAAEVAENEQTGDLECLVIPACSWAIFSAPEGTPEALIEAEMYAFTQWLPAAPYRHANAPELEVYPAEGHSVEFWLPVLPTEEIPPFISKSENQKPRPKG